MSDIAIRVENLGKKYHIGAAQKKHDSLYDMLYEVATTPFRRAKKLLSGQATGAAELDEEIWALKDISFEVERGEVVGIIGHNGAGKSTLLKILSRITEPTEGMVEIYGRVGSLLEVGTGFHPELTGRENIYLNGSVLGMSRDEIDRKFDEIVDFSGVERFIDTPIKHYSSGMSVRLAFSVAAHLEPEILVVDEVLSVGDAAFQRKSLGKMDDVAKAGRTVLFVSHHIGMINRLCERVILLDKGKIREDGNTSQVMDIYLLNDRHGAVTLFDEKDTDAYFTSVSVRNSSGVDVEEISVVDNFTVNLTYTLQRNIRGAEVSISLRDRMGNKIFGSHLRESHDSKELSKGSYQASVQIPSNFIAPGVYTIEAALHIPNVTMFHHVKPGHNFRILETGSSHAKYMGADIGYILVELPWKTRKMSDSAVSLEEQSLGSRREL